MEHQDRIGFVDPATLRDVVVDRNAMEARLEDCTDLERGWVLSLMDRGEEAVSEAQQLLAAAMDRSVPCSFSPTHIYGFIAGGTLPRCRNGRCAGSP